MNDYPVITELVSFLQDEVYGSIDAIDGLSSMRQPTHDFTKGAEVYQMYQNRADDPIDNALEENINELMLSAGFYFSTLRNKLSTEG